MNEIDYYNMEEAAGIGQAILENLENILADKDSANVAELYETTYKYTDCGPSLTVLLHDGSYRYCDDLDGIQNNNVRALLVSSIVEGSDAEVPPITVDLIDYETPEEALKAFDAAVEEVNAAATGLWDEVNVDDEEL